ASNYPAHRSRLPPAPQPVAGAIAAHDFVQRRKKIANEHDGVSNHGAAAGTRSPPWSVDWRRMEALGTVPLRTTMGNGARRLLGDRRSLGFVPAPPRAPTRVSRGRGRSARDLRRSAASLLCALTLEWERCHSERAALRV